jgi:glycosyltransferase involved in cell wall biosynthesis
MKNIAIIVNSLAPYWVESLETLADSWGDRGSIHLITGGGESNPLNAWDQPLAKIRSIKLHIFPPKRVMGTLWPESGMWRKLDELNPALVIIHEYAPYTVLSGVLWAWVNRKPLIVSTDVGLRFRKTHLSQVQILLHRIVNHFSQGIIAKTPDAFDLARSIAKPTILSPHAVSAQRYLPLCDRNHCPQKILQVGSLIPTKGVDLLIKAFVIVLKTRPDAHLNLIGNGDSAWIRRLIVHEGVKESVTIKDFLQPEELVSEYADADVFTLASRSDTYGVVVHEAAASGLPLVISRHAGASSTLVRHGENGFVIDPFDRDKYADYLLKALNPMINQLYGKASITIANQFSVENQGFQVASWLNQLVSRESFPTTRFVK